MTYAKLRTAFRVWKGDRSETSAAAILGVAPNTLGNWTDGTHIPPQTRIPALAAAMGIPAATLSAMVARERSRRLVGKAHRRGSCLKPTTRARS